MSTVAIVGMGLLLVIVVGEIDLSFGFLYGLCANTMAVAWLMWGWPVWLALIAAFAVAIFWGLFNAFFTTVVKIPSFIATLGSGTLIFGFTLLITNTKTFNYLYPEPGIKVTPGDVDLFRGLANQALPEKFPMQAVWMIGIALVVLVPAQPLAVRVPAQGHRRQPGGRAARPPAGAQVQVRGVRHHAR